MDIFAVMDKKSYTFDEIKLKMANYCTYQDRCHQEVENKMRDFTLIPEAKDEILLFLMREGFLNEERFTRSYIRGKFNLKKWGRNKIRQHLKFKGVPDKLINSSMDEIDERDYRRIAAELLEKTLEKNSALQAYQQKSKSISYLLSRGYEYDLLLELYGELSKNP